MYMLELPTFVIPSIASVRLIRYRLGGKVCSVLSCSLHLSICDPSKVLLQQFPLV